MKKGVLLFTILFFVLLLNKNAVGLGISGNKDYEYKPGAVEKGVVCFVNTLNEPDAIKIWMTGDLAQYIEFDVPEEIKPLNETILAPGETACYGYILRHPERFDKPGYHTATVYAKELPPPPTEEGGVGFVVLVEMKHRIRVFVPYPGKYLESKLNIPSVKEGEKAKIRVEVESKGNESIEEVYGIVDILRGNEKVSTVKTNTLDVLGPRKKKKLKAEWSTEGMVPGSYRANSTVVYNKGLNFSTSSTDFLIGTLRIDATSFSNQSYAHAINRFKVYLKSEWNDPVEKVYAKVVIKNETKLAQFETAPVTVPGFRTAVTEGYFDATEFGTGVYDAEITVFFSNKTSTFEGKHYIIKKPEKKKGFKLQVSNTTLIITALLIMVVLNVLWILWQKKREKEKEKKGAKG